MQWLTPDDSAMWVQGRHVRAYDKLGGHLTDKGAWFTLWAPYADRISVIGDFNDWAVGRNELVKVGAGLSGLWESFVEGAHKGQHYKFHIERGDFSHDKTDPYAFALEAPISGGNPLAGMSSILTDMTFDWTDDHWMESRKGPGSLDQPISIYEVHIGSWIKKADGYSLGYRAIAKPLADHVEEMGFTHIELMPVMEHPYYASWGYQVVGYFAPTYRYGSPSDLKYMIDYLHSRGIGVLLDWVPAHFAADPQGLVFYDGSTLYEYDDPLMRYHPDWGTYVFDYHKPGVVNFLVSNALFWLDKYHIDGLRVDAVASMLYRDYSRDNWTPNMFGGRENLEAIDLIKLVNETVYSEHGEAMMIAEESTAWPAVSSPTYAGGLGFLYKWNMGWMHDTLEYMSKDPVHRKYHHNDLTFPLIYAFSEHFILPLSHDEVVHLKGSLWEKMPGDVWQKAANLRLLYSHLFGHPGKKLLFMGGEFGQVGEWNHDTQLEWHWLEHMLHDGIKEYFKVLNHFYSSSPALANDREGGFRWIDLNDVEQSVVSYERSGGDEIVVFIMNFTPVVRPGYRVGAPVAGRWQVVVNSDDHRFGGSGVGHTDHVLTEDVAEHGHDQSFHVTLPPLGALVLRTTRPQTGSAKE